MELGKETINTILDLKRPETLQIEDLQFIRTDYREVQTPTPSTLKVGTLDAIVEFIKRSPDKLDRTKILVHVESPTTVSLFSEVLEPFKNRATYLEAEYEPKIQLDKQMGVEAFIVYLQTQFEMDEELLKVIETCSKVTDVRELEVSDSGVSQGINLKAGVITKAESKIKNPVTLKPRRSFPEISQVPCELVFRIIKNGDNLNMVLMEADGGLWKLDAVKAIKYYLDSCLNSDIKENEKPIAIIG